MEKNKTGLSHVLTLVITALIWLVYEERYTREREKARQGDEGKGNTRKGLVISKGKAMLCLPWSKKLFNEMIGAAQPTSKVHMPARASRRQCGGLLRVLEQERRYILCFRLHAWAGRVIVLRI